LSIARAGFGLVAAVAVIIINPGPIFGLGVVCAHIVHTRLPGGALSIDRAGFTTTPVQQCTRCCAQLLRTALCICCAAQRQQSHQGRHQQGNLYSIHISKHANIISRYWLLVTSVAQGLNNRLGAAAPALMVAWAVTQGPLPTIATPITCC
jgi:hypothetical protein